MLKRSPTGMLDRLLTLFFQEAENGVLSRDVLERRRDVRLAQYRAIALRDIMSFNLDTDPQITAEEIEKQQDILEAKRRARLVTLLYEFDRDRDGGLSAAEIEQAIEAQIAQHRATRLPGAQLLYFDLNADDQVTEAEIVKAVDLLQAQIRMRDQNRKTAVVKKKQKDIADKREARLAPKRIALAPAGLPGICQFPPKSQTAKVHWVGARRGDALSTLAISGLDEVTTHAKLHIEGGDDPLYLVIGAGTPVIWQLSGAVERVEQVVLQPGNAMQGIAADKVFFVPDPVCAPGAQLSNGKNRKEIFRDVLEVAFELDRLSGQSHPDLGHVRVPSGKRIVSPLLLDPVPEPIVRGNKVFEKRDGRTVQLSLSEVARRQLEFRHRGQYPYGVAKVDPATVVMQGSAEPYTLLPQEAGLLQLMDQGALRGEGIHDLIITRSIASLPAGLPMSTGRRVGQRFLVEPGVKLDVTSGNLGGFLFLDAETGGCVEGIPCTQIQPLE